MKRVGNIEAIQKVDSLLKASDRSRLVKDGYKEDCPFGNGIKPGMHTKIYEVYIGPYLYRVKLGMDSRARTGEVTLSEQNLGILYKGIDGLYDNLQQLEDTAENKKGRGDIDLVKLTEELIKKHEHTIISATRYRGYEMREYQLWINGLLFFIKFGYDKDSNYGWIDIRERSLKKLYRAIPKIEEIISGLYSTGTRWAIKRN